VSFSAATGPVVTFWSVTVVLPVVPTALIEPGSNATPGNAHAYWLGEPVVMSTAPVYVLMSVPPGSYVASVTCSVFETT
jgi:hypothetical protein